MAEEAKKPATAPVAAPATPAAPATAPAAGEKGKKEKKEKGPGFLASRTPRELIILKITGFVLLIVLMDFLMIQPTYRYLKKVNEQIDLEEKMIPNRLKILQHRERIFAEYRRLHPYMTDKTLAQEEETARLLREIERVSKEASLFVSNINPVKVDAKSDTIYQLSLDIEGKGGITQIRQFMRSLESQNPPIRISGFNFKPQSKDSDDLKFSFSIVKIGAKERPLNAAK